MAQEITIQGSLTLQRSTGSIQAVASATGNSPTSGNGILNVQSVSNGDTAISIGNVSFATAGYLFVKNLEATNSIEVGYDESGTRKYFTKLRPSEFCLIPVEPGKSYYGKASAGATNYIQVGAVEAS
jgi:hypothetical protein